MAEPDQQSQGHERRREVGPTGKLTLRAGSIAVLGAVVIAVLLLILLLR